jgi:hypothetical protein
MSPFHRPHKFHPVHVSIFPTLHPISLFPITNDISIILPHRSLDQKAQSLGKPDNSTPSPPESKQHKHVHFPPRRSRSPPKGEKQRGTLGMCEFTTSYFRAGKCEARLFIERRKYDREIGTTRVRKLMQNDAFLTRVQANSDSDSSNGCWS